MFLTLEGYVLGFSFAGSSITPRVTPSPLSDWPMTPSPSTPPATIPASSGPVISPLVVFDFLAGQRVPGVAVIPLGRTWAVYRTVNGKPTSLVASGFDRAAVETEALAVVRGRHLQLVAKEQP